jgi:outer membrane protein assembly factor BamB
VGLLFGIVVCTAPEVRAQTTFTRQDLLTRTALEKVGLEKFWSAVVPLNPAGERVLEVNHNLDQVYVQTNLGYLHVFDAETGRYLWGYPMGNIETDAFPIGGTSDLVVATNQFNMFAFDRKTGRLVWKVRLEDHPTSATAVSDKVSVVGLRNGKLVAYNNREIEVPNFPSRSPGKFAWNYQTNAQVTARPIVAERIAAFASQDGKVYVTLYDQKKLLYRFKTGGPISGSMGTHGTRTLIVPSEDNLLYAVDLFTGETKWSVATGSPIKDEPLVAGDTAFVVNDRGIFFSVDIPSGNVNWQVPTRNAHLIAVSPTRLYVQSAERDLAIADRATGRVLMSPRETLEQAGLNLRNFTIGETNHDNDRIYLSTPTGMLVALRELGATAPAPLYDAKQPPFGTFPADLAKFTPPQSEKAPPVDQSIEVKPEREPADEPVPPGDVPPPDQP